MTACLLFTTLAASCGPSQDQLTSAARQSARLASLIDKGVRAVAEQYKTGVINLAEKDRLAGILARANSAGLAFNNVISRYSTLTPEAAADLQTHFSALSAAFLELVDNGTFNVSSPKARDTLRLAFAGLSAAVTIISGVVSFASRAHAVPSNALEAWLDSSLVQSKWTTFRATWLKETNRVRL